MSLRTSLSRLLWSGVLLFAVTLVFGLLGLVLVALGDDGGAQLMLGVSAGFLVCFSLNFLALVFVMALGQLSMLNESNQQDDGDPPKHAD